MTFVTIITLIVLLSLVALGTFERRNHMRHLSRIPIRIHVNGMRGKSSTVRLIAAGLREGGIRTFAKTSGTLPVQILPDGTEVPIERPSRQANVIEQTRMVSLAASYGVQALVIECMAVEPALQSACELQMIRSTHGVITNVGPDHLDIMGPTEADVARALTGTVPVRGKLFSSEERYTQILAEAAADRGTRLIVVGRDDVSRLPAGATSGFSYIEHAENVALALSVCENLGVPRGRAMAGMWKARPDAGAMTVQEIRMESRSLVFVNGFAANDPSSTGQVWNLARERFPGVGGRIALVNCRGDRPLRSWQLGVACASWEQLDCCLVMGSGSFLFMRAALGRGLPPERIDRLGRRSNREILKAILSHAGESALVVGVGNTGEGGRGGLEFVEFLRRGDFHG